VRLHDRLLAAQRHHLADEVLVSELDQVEDVGVGHPVELDDRAADAHHGRLARTALAGLAGDPAYAHSRASA
jgi:hypothetical protein